MQHLLFLAHRIPYPPTKGDKVRPYHLLKYLASRYRVHLGAFVDDEADFEHAHTLRALCEECHLVRLKPALAKLKSLAGLVSREPLTLPYYRSVSMHRWVKRVMRAAPIQGVLVFSSLSRFEHLLTRGAVHAAGDYHTAPKKVLRAVGASRRMS